MNFADLLFLFLSISFNNHAVLAQSSYHKPLQTHPGTCVNHVGQDIDDVGAIVWIALAEKWIMTDQKNLLVFSLNGTLERKSNKKVTCKGAESHEGFALVDSPRCFNDFSRRCYSASDCIDFAPCNISGPFSDDLWVQDENIGYRCTNDPTLLCATGGIPDDSLCKLRSNETSSACKATGAVCRFSITKILNMGSTGYSKTPSAEEEVFVPNIPFDSDEGLSFVPDTESGGRYNGTFFWGEQNNARFHKFMLDPFSPLLTWLEYVKPPSGCGTGEEISDGYYDFVQRKFYSQSDGGNRYTVHDSKFETCFARVDDPKTCRAVDNGFEGLAFGGGKFAYVDDAQNHEADQYNGIWIFDDDFCGDDVRVASEVCDGLDLRGLDCSTAPDSACATSRCGPSFTGLLTCKRDCSKFDDSACAGSAPLNILMIGLVVGASVCLLGVGLALTFFLIRRRRQQKVEMHPYNAINAEN